MTDTVDNMTGSFWKTSNAFSRNSEMRHYAVLARSPSVVGQSVAP